MEPAHGVAARAAKQKHIRQHSDAEEMKQIDKGDRYTQRPQQDAPAKGPERQAQKHQREAADDRGRIADELGERLQIDLTPKKKPGEQSEAERRLGDCAP
jgi:hypothetical protein